MAIIERAEILDFDPSELEAKYAAEREKRLRPDGNAQYESLDDRFAHLADDPHGSPAEREPIKTELECLLVGGGFANLIAAAHLKAAGITNIHIIDRATDFGGAWYWNRYPGVQCDIESYIYLPLLESLGYIPERKYAFGSEIQSHARAIAKKLDLYNDAIFGTTVIGAQWNDGTGRWDVSTDRGDEFSVRYLGLATGPLDRPKLPKIDGIERFEGHVFHTSRWDYEYTGGDSQGGLDKLVDKRIAVIGTGSTAIQCIPHVARSAEHLYVVQRTPAAVDIRGDRPTDPSWSDALEEGWQGLRRLNFSEVLSGAAPAEGDLVDDGWTVMYRERAAIDPSMDKVARREALAQSDMRVMERIRHRIDTIIEDPQTAEKLKPWYARWCKRPQFHDEYYQSFNRESVTLVDTDGKGVDSVTAQGLVVAGVEYDVDCIIFATGYEVGTDFAKTGGFDLIGRDGLNLREKWSGGYRTLHGMFTAGFPNLFILGQTQTGLSPNYCYTVEGQAKHLAYVLGEVNTREAVTFEVDLAAEDEFVDHFRSVNIGNNSYYQQCTPGFFTNEGRFEEYSKGLLASFYGKGPEAFFDLLETWRKSGDMAGLKIETEASRRESCERV